MTFSGLLQIAMNSTDNLGPPGLSQGGPLLAGHLRLVARIPQRLDGARG